MILAACQGFPFTKLFIELQGEVVARLSKLSASLLALTSKGNLARWAPCHRRRTMKLLQMGATAGDVRLFNLLPRGFFFPSSRHDLHVLIASLEAGQEEFARWFLLALEPSSLSLTELAREQEAPNPYQLLVEVMGAAGRGCSFPLIHTLLHHLERYTRGCRDLSLSFKDNPTPSPYYALRLAALDAAIRACRCDLFPDMLAQWGVLWIRIFDRRHLLFSSISTFSRDCFTLLYTRLGFHMPIPYDGQFERLPPCSEAISFLRWLSEYEVHIPECNLLQLALREKRRALVQYILDYRHEFLPRELIILFPSFTSPSHAEIFSLLLAHPAVQSIPLCSPHRTYIPAERLSLPAVEFLLATSHVFSLLSSKRLFGVAVPESADARVLLFLHEHDVLELDGRFQCAYFLSSAVVQDDPALFDECLEITSPGLLALAYGFSTEHGFEGAELVLLLLERWRTLHALLARGTITFKDKDVDIVLHEARYRYHSLPKFMRILRWCFFHGYYPPTLHPERGNLASHRLPDSLVEEIKCMWKRTEEVTPPQQDAEQRTDLP